MLDIPIPTGEIYSLLSLDRSGRTARIHYGYSFQSEDAHRLADLFLLATTVLRLRINLIGVRGNHSNVIDEALKLDNLPEVAQTEPWEITWSAPNRGKSLTSGEVRLEQSPMPMGDDKRLMSAVYSIAPLTNEYLDNLRASPIGPFMEALPSIPQATCTINLDFSRFGIGNRSAPKYFEAAISHLWATLIAGHHEDEEFFSVILDVVEMCRLIELGGEQAPVLQPFLAGIVVDECMKWRAQQGS